MADVILANPPFMSPKGGIKPHNRFTVPSKRSEVLFVDYMAEHLTPGGRAGIIVPEGIIFQSQTAYKALRKMLVEQYLVAVVSLPTGVFNPYSGVKTSILILDKSLAKQSETVGFFKVENDGFNLGAQRRPIDKNDLPQVLAEIGEFLRRLRAKKSIAREDITSTRGLIVAKDKIAANGDFNLSGERYRDAEVRNHTFPHVRLEEVCTINPPKSEVLSLPSNTPVSFVPMADLGENRIAFRPKETKRIEELGTSYTYFADGDVLVAKVTPCFENGKAGIAKDLTNGVGFGSSEFYVLRPSDLVLPEFIYFCVTHAQFRKPAIEQMTGTGGLQRVPKGFVEGFEIPLPPLEVQKEIVAEIEAYQKVIDGARAVLDHYRPHFPINPEWPMVELGELCEINSGGTPKREVDVYWHGNIPWITTSLINFNIIDRAEEFITKEGLASSSAWIVPKGTVVMAMFGQGVTRGRVATLGIDAAMNQACAAFKICDDRITSAYLFHALHAEYEKLRELSEARGGNQSNLSGTVLKQYAIPLPPIAEQKKIVAEIKAEQLLVDGNSQLIERMEQKIAAVLARIWGEPEAVSAGPVNGKG